MRKIVIIIALLAAAAVAPAMADRAAVDAAKAQCVIGERNDGYLGVVAGQSASPDLDREIRSINQQRKAAYAELATRNGVTIEAAAVLTAERLINQAPSGHCVQDASGAWIKKP